MIRSSELHDSERKISGSFRDPSGFMFRLNDTLYRQVNGFYQADYDLLMSSGLYERLTKSGALIAHTEVDTAFAPLPELVYKVIQPQPIEFISYPYEWCFLQLKDAALLTLAIARRSLEYGMSLKDASAYNVQFQDGKAIFIDTLSFEAYKEGEPWVAYRQFCQHFLSPLALMVYCDIRLNQLLRVNIDGIPLEIASELLPYKTRLNFGLLTHIHAHAKSQKRYSDRAVDKSSVQGKVSLTALKGLFDSLISTVKGLDIRVSTDWSNYYQETNYSPEAFNAKKEAIGAFISRVNPKTIWDLGANTGEFSRVAGDMGIKTVAFDIDSGAVMQNYKEVKAKHEKNILPLLMDLTNPSPSLGWRHQERNSFVSRGPADMVMALALIHHLAIANNVPLADVAVLFAELGQNLIVEFVPKTDSQVKRLLATRADIFPQYTQEGFEAAFSQYFTIVQSVGIQDSERILYLMEKRFN